MCDWRPRGSQGAPAARDNAELQLTYTHVVAPAAGIVSRKQVEPGQLIQAGQPLLTIVADTGIYVTANFKETQLADLRVGQPAEIDVDAYGGATATGVVESVSAATGSKFALLPPDNATGNFTKVVQRVPVRIRVTHDLGADPAAAPRDVGHRARRRPSSWAERTASELIVSDIASPAGGLRVAHELPTRRRPAAWGLVRAAGVGRAAMKTSTNTNISSPSR